MHRFILLFPVAQEEECQFSNAKHIYTILSQGKENVKVGFYR
jgi:hypothetical protein